MLFDQLKDVVIVDAHVNTVCPFELSISVGATKPPVCVAPYPRLIIAFDAPEAVNANPIAAVVPTIVNAPVILYVVPEVNVYVLVKLVIDEFVNVVIVQVPEPDNVALAFGIVRVPHDTAPLNVSVDAPAIVIPVEQVSGPLNVELNAGIERLGVLKPPVPPHVIE